MRKLLKGISLSVITGVLIVGALLVIGFHSALNATNTESFCISCHEMGIAYEEYKDTVHYKNRTGVRATCSDCHVPQDFGPKMIAKIRAAKDVWHHLIGTIDSKEKYENYRLTMAKAVWQNMEETDSRECRVCHTVASMDFEEQQGRAARKHQKMAEKGQTCIDCHKGVAHELPEDFDEEDE
ncbi:MAG: NapC/NirT family cytochrome c [Gammaproteobacteria bacterium]|nr:NapC/NirT family cytochrome c [Gammaproteobacteria bacterium]MCF6260985.1 NapC/NirT family cytochrome c [Gammaproteobacteria bacterium]